MRSCRRPCFFSPHHQGLLTTRNHAGLESTPGHAGRVATPASGGHKTRTTISNFGGAMLCRPYGTYDWRDAEAPTEVVGYSLSSLRDWEPFAFLSPDNASV